MLFTEPVSVHRLLEKDNPERTVLLDRLFAALRHAFPDIEFQLLPRLDLYNAEAIRSGERRRVKLYGGLAYHRAVGRDALTFAALHEIGHHLAPGPRLPWNPWLACECAADAWAQSVGALTLAGASKWTFRMQSALEELGEAMRDEAGRSEQPDRLTQCWAISWERRSAGLARALDAPGECRLAQHIFAAPTGPASRC